MRAVIAGAGAVGASIARELHAHGHEVVVVEARTDAARKADVGGARLVLGDACDLTVLEQCGALEADVLVAATGDDRVNLVCSLLSRSEFGVGRTVARVNNPLNDWLFDESWGVDVAVSTPSIMTALVEEAVETGDLVRLLRLEAGGAALSEFRVPAEHWLEGRRIGTVSWPQEAPLVAVVRDGAPGRRRRTRSWRWATSSSSWPPAPPSRPCVASSSARAAFRGVRRRRSPPARRRPDRAS